MSTPFLQDTLDGLSTQYDLNAASHEMSLENHRFDVLADHLEAAALQADSDNRLSLEYGRDYSGRVGNDDANVKFAISGEYFKHLLKKAWQMIWNMLKRFFRWISEWLSKLFAGVKRMRSSAEKMIKYAEQLRENGVRPTSTTISIGGASRLHMGGKVNAEELIEGLANVKSVLGQALDIHIDASGELFDKIDDVTEDLNRLDKMDVRKLEQAINELNNYPHRLRMDMHAYMHKNRDKELPGGYVAQVGSVTTDNEGRPKNMPNIELVVKSNRPMDEKVDVIPMTPDQLIDSIQGVLDVLDEISDRERRVKRLSDDFKKMNEAANKVLGNAAMADKIQEVLHPHSYRMLIWFYRMAIPGSLNNVFNYQYAVARTTLQYATESLKDYP